MTDGWGFLLYMALIYGLIASGLSFLLVLFFLIFRSFRIFLCSKSFWIAWILPCLLLSTICVSTGLRIGMEWRWLELHIGGLSLPLVYFLRKAFIRKHLNLVPNKLSSWIIWIIPMSICSFLFILVCILFGLYVNTYII